MSRPRCRRPSSRCSRMQTAEYATVAAIEHAVLMLARTVHRLSDQRHLTFPVETAGPGAPQGEMGGPGWSRSNQSDYR
jgi:hypothetical protein